MLAALLGFAAFWFLLTGLLVLVVRDYQRSRRRVTDELNTVLPMLDHYRGDR
jgi:hypothetical protein